MTSGTKNDMPHSKLNPHLKAFKTYSNLLKSINKFEVMKSETTNENITYIGPNVESGAVSYALPCQALNNRGIKNEMRRLEIEMYNKKMIELYENPGNALNLYDGDLKKFKAMLISK